MILVVMEQTGGAWHKMSWETLAGGQQLGKSLGQPVAAVVLGANLDAGHLAAELATKALQKVYSVEHALLAEYTPDAYTAALTALIGDLQPTLVLFPHTYQVRDFAPKLATRLDRVLISDVVRVNEGPVFVRQLFQGKLNADMRPATPAPHLVSLQSGAYRADTLEAGSAPVETIVPVLDAPRQQPEPRFRESSRAVDLTAAGIIVSVGRGIRESENIPLVEALAQALGAEMAASRPICDNGWLPMERQVGSSGQTVAPKVYLAVGISGAIQHLVGMKGSKSIVAINKDPHAPIFEVADYGLVGDLFEIVPALTDEIRKAKV